MSDRAVNVIIGAALASTFASTMRKAGAEVKNLGDTLKNTKLTLGKIEDLQKQEKAVSRTGTAWRKAHDEARKASLDMKAAVVESTLKPSEEASEKVAVLTATFAKARAEARGSRDAYQGASEALVKMRIAAREAGVDTAHLAQEATRVGAAIREAEHEMERFQKRAERREAFRTARDETVKSALALGGLVAAMRPAVAKAGEMEHALAGFGVVAGDSKARVAEVRQEILNLAASTNQSATGLVEGLQILVGKGLDEGKSVASLQAIGRTATATGASIEDLSNTAFSLVDTLKIDPKDLGKTMDIIAQSAKEGGFEVKNMAKEFPALTAAASLAGMSGQKAVASIGAALQVGLKGAGSPSEAANNLLNFFQKMTSQETVKNFKKVGVDLEKEMKGWAKRGADPIEEMLKLIGSKTEGGKNAFKLSALFQDMQVQNFIKPLLQQMDEFQRIRAKSFSAEGVNDADFKTMMDTYEEQVKRLSNATYRLGEAFGHALLPVLTPVASVLGTVVDAVARGVDAFPQATAAVTSFVTAALGITTVVSSIRLAGAALALLGEGGAAVGAGLAAAAGPIGWALAGIVAIGAAAYVIKQNWADVGPYFAGVWGGVTAGASAAWEVLSAGAAAAWEGVKAAFADTTIGNAFVTVGQTFQQVGDTIAGVWENVKGKASEAIDFITAKIQGLMGPIEALIGKLTAAGQWLADSKVGQAIGYVAGKTRDGFNGAYDKAKNALGGTQGGSAAPSGGSGAPSQPAPSPGTPGTVVPTTSGPAAPSPSAGGPNTAPAKPTPSANGPSAAPAAAAAAPVNKNTTVNVNVNVSVNATGVGLNEVKTMIATTVKTAVDSSASKIAAEVRRELHD